MADLKATSALLGTTALTVGFLITVGATAAKQPATIAQVNPGELPDNPGPGGLISPEPLPDTAPLETEPSNPDSGITLPSPLEPSPTAPLENESRPIGSPLEPTPINPVIIDGVVPDPSANPSPSNTAPNNTLPNQSVPNQSVPNPPVPNR
jgi:hypothetical protein